MKNFEDEATLWASITFLIFAALIVGYFIGKGEAHPELDDLYYVEQPIDTLGDNGVWTLIKDGNNNYFMFKNKTNE